MNQTVYIYNQVKPLLPTVDMAAKTADDKKAAKTAEVDNATGVSNKGTAPGLAKADTTAQAANLHLAAGIDKPGSSTKPAESAMPDPDKFVIVFTKYGAFMAAVATAKNSDEMESAIEAFVLPAGSSSVKRESPFNVSLNAYTGLFLGHESIQGISDKRIFNTYGVTAPIGISISRGERHLFNPWCGNGHASYSVFISLIDIGAAAAFRFKDDTTAQVPKIQLKNILSPGIFLSIGLPKMPISFNLGAQMGPNLRQIDNNNNSRPSADASNRIYVRYSASLVVDIPLLNLYTKSR